MISAVAKKKCLAAPKFCLRKDHRLMTGSGGEKRPLGIAWNAAFAQQFSLSYSFVR
jgi:hypothetical protein